MAWSIDVEDVEDVKMLLDILSTMNNALNDQLALSLVDICTYTPLTKIWKPFEKSHILQWKSPMSKVFKISPKDTIAVERTQQQKGL